MSAAGIADALVASSRRRRHDVIICNFANADMVGHTGSLEAAIAAVETRRRLPRPRHHRPCSRPAARAIVTADHGNAEQMWDDALNAPHTAHTTNPVPVILVQGPGEANPPRAAGTARSATSRRRCWRCWDCHRRRR